MVSKVLAEHTASTFRTEMMRMGDGLYNIENNKHRSDYMTNWSGPYQNWTSTGGRHHVHKKLSPGSSLE
jgi:hypothetical protein